MNVRVLLGLFCIATLSFSGGTLISQSPAPIEPIAPAGVVQWDFTGLNADGTACDDLASFVLAAFQLDGTTQINSVVVPACGPQGAMTCGQAIAALELSNGPYLLKVRSVDFTGNASDWSDPLAVTVDGVKPSVPSMPRIKVTVTVEIN